MKNAKLTVTVLFLLFWAISPAQEKTNAVEKRESSLQLSFYKKADLTKTARVKVTAKNEKRKFEPAKNAHVNFYAQNNKEEVLVAKAVTSGDGKATVELPKNLPLNTDMKFTIIAKIENDNIYTDAQDQGSFKDANLTLSVNPADTSRTVTLKATETGKDGKEKPVADVAVNLYVKRMFGTMPAAEDHTVNTDATGEATFSLPRDVKGDTTGNITIVARIDDNETYGNVESKVDAKFGIPLEAEKDPFPRALWEPQAPAPLVITVSVIFTAVWFTYFTIFFRLIKISRDKHLPTTGKPPLELTYENLYDN